MTCFLSFCNLYKLRYVGLVKIVRIVAILIAGYNHSNLKYSFLLVWICKDGYGYRHLSSFSLFFYEKRGRGGILIIIDICPKEPRSSKNIDDPILFISMRWLSLEHDSYSKGGFS